MRARAKLIPGLLAAAMASAPASAADTGSAAQLASLCSSCHRLDGHGGGTPPIVGLDRDRFESLMKAFRADNHPNHIMHAVSLALSDEEVAALAGFLATRDRQGERP